ncbi:LOW QUALITY PROTEIN: zinc-alpha-2-glycoprotein-like [Sarcophilus harrisii]
MTPTSKGTTESRRTEPQSPRGGRSHRAPEEGGATEPPRRAEPQSPRGGRSHRAPEEGGATEPPRRAEPQSPRGGRSHRAPEEGGATEPPRRAEPQSPRGGRSHRAPEEGGATEPPRRAEPQSQGEWTQLSLFLSVLCAWAFTEKSADKGAKESAFSALQAQPAENVASEKRGSLSFSEALSAPEQDVPPPAHHRHMGQFTAVGTCNSLLELSVISFMDDVPVGSYNNIYKQINIKIPWIFKALGADYITKRDHLLVDHEQHFRWIIPFLSKNDTNPNRNHTAQLLTDCEIDNDVKVKSHVHLIWDGVEYYRIDEEVGQWDNLKPETNQYQQILDTPYWTDLRKRFMSEYCVDLLRKIIGYSSLRDNVPPEVTVSRHVNSEVRIILSCTATGFYPRSILLQWKKNGELGVWGKETSSGILPNMDSTFYLRLTLELPPEDSGTGFTCVVEHTELKTPAVYPVLF